MKTELVDVNETRKELRVEVPSEVVDVHIARVAQDYGRRARIPGFRPGKAPSRVIRQRFKAEILHDVLHDLVPRMLDDAMRQKGVEAVNTHGGLRHRADVRPGRFRRHFAQEAVRGRR